MSQHASAALIDIKLLGLFEGSNGRSHLVLTGMGLAGDTCHTAQVWINSWGSDASARHMELSLGRKGGQEAQAFWEAPGKLMGWR
jgi:hypothetical protein